jgi:hypothetical protein
MNKRVRSILGMGIGLILLVCCMPAALAAPACKCGPTASKPVAVRPKAAATVRPRVSSAPGLGYTPSEYPGVFVRNVPTASAPRPQTGLTYKLPDGVTTPTSRRTPAARSSLPITVRKSNVPGTDLVADLGDSMMTPIVAHMLPSGQVVVECQGQSIGSTSPSTPCCKAKPASGCGSSAGCSTGPCGAAPHQHPATSDKK